ncbi:MAG: hypothetical protein IPP45_14365 [Sphingomonadales bacterium]|nr:hypothetical protein [Sphingomonadales bacterium]
MTDRTLARSRSFLITLVFFGAITNLVDQRVLSFSSRPLRRLMGGVMPNFAHFAAMYPLAAATALLLDGWLDRFGVRLAYGAAVVIWSIAGMAHAFTANVTQFITARVILVAARSVNTPAAVKAATRFRRSGNTHSLWA